MKSNTAKEFLKSRGLKNPPINSGISGGDAPRTYVSDIMELYAGQSRWISVEEELPPNGQVVSLWHSAQNIECTGFYDGNRFNFVHAHLCCPQLDDDYRTNKTIVDVLPDKITHWKPTQGKP